MVRWLRISLGVFFILLPDPTLVTDVLGAMLLAGSLWPTSKKHSYANAPCRCYGCLLGLPHSIPQPHPAHWRSSLS